MSGSVARDESGFTLPEVLVAMVMMLTVMFALYSIFDMSLRVFSFGNDKVEATEGARIGVARMEREIRAAYPYDKADGDETLLDTPADATNTISFRNDLDGDRVAESSEEITYSISADSTKLLRNGDSAVENLSSINFDYQDAQGNSLDPATQLDQAEIVEIDLTVNVDGRTQNISTDVALRNKDG